MGEISMPDSQSRFKAGGEGASCWSVLTLVLWTGCLAVGWLGFVLPYSRPHAGPRQPEPVHAEILNVELVNDQLPPPDLAPPPPDLAQPPPLPDPVVLPPAPRLLPVAQPSPAIAFALPVEGPVRIVEAKHAAYVQPPAQAMPAPVAAPQVQKLIYGQGEGRQPLPDYPPQALRAGQEGKVTIRASVGANGRVIAVEATEPSPWKLLNAAALRVVRERWRFPPGPIRLYEVSIRFEIKK
jgi:protein TonB